MKTGIHRIFLVEDNAGDVYLLQAALQEQGIEHEIEHYVNADAAIEAISSLGKDERELPHVILLDYNRENLEDVVRLAVDRSLQIVEAFGDFCQGD